MICFAHLCADAQTVRVINTETKASFRGLSVVNDQTLWVSGTGGTVGRSIDGGTSWKWITVKGFEKTDFRDIEAFDDKTAIIMGIASPAYILKTTDAGDNWKIVYENKDSSMFLDAMEFWNEQSGIVIGDPIQHRFFIARTFDGGDHWQMIPENYRPLADSGEACFASSGTNIRKLNIIPIANFSNNYPSYIIPDASVRVTEDGVHVTLNDEYIPNVKLNQFYIELMSEGDKNTKTFLKEKIDKANTLI